MSDWTVAEVDGNREWHKDSRAEAEEAVEQFDDLNLKIVGPDDATNEPQEQGIIDGADIVDTEEHIDQDDKPQKTRAPHPEEFNNELPETQPGVDTDPLDWVPSDFVDYIDGTAAINRKGYDVLAHHYNISVETNVLVSPNETDFEYAEVEAIAKTEDGVKYKAHGSAHVDRGDDSYLLLEMADTRAAKRATARATGVGMVAVSELQNEL